jgi:hypothetical protein
MNISPRPAMWFTAAVAAVFLGSSGVHAQRAVRPFEEMSDAALALRDSVVTLARAQIGQRYVLGGQTPDRGFDCSGLVRYVLAALDLQTPRTASQQASLGTAVVKDPHRLRPGDLLTFTNGKGAVSHIGIYIGDGRYVHASSTAGRVIESSLSRSMTALRTIWQGARRLVAFDDPGDTTTWKLSASRRVASAAVGTSNARIRSRKPMSVVRRSNGPPPLPFLAAMFARRNPKDAFTSFPVKLVVGSAKPTNRASSGAAQRSELVRLITSADVKLLSGRRTLPFAESLLR